MQLFITNSFKIQEKTLTIYDNPALTTQLRKVLRAKPWYPFLIQNFEGEKRYEVNLVAFTDKTIENSIQAQYTNPQKQKKTGMLIAYPNKQDKLELIIQKLTEIWISDIFLWASERSVISWLNQNKKNRLEKIMQEATEQSLWRKLPNLQEINDFSLLEKKRNLHIFDIAPKTTTPSSNKKKLPLLGVIGPEWGLTAQDYKKFGKSFEVHTLGDSILRMETATIIAGRLIQQEKL